MTKATVASEVIGPVTSVGASSLVVLARQCESIRIPLHRRFSTALRPCLNSRAPLSKCTASAIRARRSRRRESSCESARVCCASPHGDGSRERRLQDRHADDPHGHGDRRSGGESVAKRPARDCLDRSGLVNGELVARVIRIGGTAIPENAALTVEAWSRTSRRLPTCASAASRSMQARLSTSAVVLQTCATAVGACERNLQWKRPASLPYRVPVDCTGSCGTQRCSGKLRRRRELLPGTRLLDEGDCADNLCARRRFQPGQWRTGEGRGTGRRRCCRGDDT